MFVNANSLFWPWQPSISLKCHGTEIYVSDRHSVGSF
jgi:hypothetical protein